ncbi:MAG TPA: hypothetical protein VN809_16085 [Telmatospirillum sp.]|nr:hypothetical protein [Telmatospirillum sp.]
MKKLFVVLAALVLGACARTIYNVDQPIPAGAQALPMDRIEMLIVEAGKTRHWTFEHAGSGHLIATQAQGGRVAVVNIMFDQNRWRIDRRSTTGMSAEGGAFHSQYNSWVRNLELDISTRLANAAVFAR